VRRDGSFDRQAAWPYQAARAAVLEAISSTAGVPLIQQVTSVFGLHSLRSGGATTAAGSGEVGSAAMPAHVFMAHGGWRTQAAMAVYIRPTLNQRLAVSAAAMGMAAADPASGSGRART
jgi:hypothetical protein